MSTATARALEKHPVSGFFARAETVRPPIAIVEIGLAAGKQVRVGGRALEPGTYSVRLDESRERIVLENEKRTYALSAFFRRGTGPANDTVAAHLVGDGESARRFLVVRLTSGLEWVA